MSVAPQCLSLTHTIQSLAPATEFVRRGAQEAGFSVNRLAEVELVLEELFMNVARHAYLDGLPGLVEIIWSVPQPGLLCVDIADRGIAFNPLTRAEPDLNASLNERPVGGLGIFLIRRLTQSLEYRRDGNWNRVHFEMF